MDVLQVQLEERGQVVKPADVALHAMCCSTRSSSATAIAPMISDQGEADPELAGDVDHDLHLFSVAEQPNAFN